MDNRKFTNTFEQKDIEKKFSNPFSDDYSKLYSGDGLEQINRAGANTIYEGAVERVSQTAELGTLTASVIPSTGSTYNLGSSSKAWANVYADSYHDGSGNTLYMFKSITTPDTNVVSADSLVDNLTLTGSEVTITSNPGTDTIDFATEGNYDYMCSLYDGTGSTGNTGALTAVGWDTQREIDTTYFTHSTSTNNSRIVVDEAGVYNISASINFLNDLTDRSVMRIALYKNGTVVPGTEAYTYVRYSTYGAYSSCTMTVKGVSATASQYFEIKHDAQAGTGAFGSGCNYQVLANSYISVEKVKVQ